jgi:hypothetical protein
VFLEEAIIKGVKLGGELSLSHIVKVSKKIDVHKLLPKYFHFFSIIYLMVYAGASAYNKPLQHHQRGLNPNTMFNYLTTSPLSNQNESLRLACISHFALSYISFETNPRSKQYSIFKSNGETLTCIARVIKNSQYSLTLIEDKLGIYITKGFKWGGNYHPHYIVKVSKSPDISKLFLNYF